MSVIEESGMKFNFNSKHSLFNIEKSKVLKKLGAGYKIVEFIALDRNDNIVIIEAKSAGYIISTEVQNYKTKIDHIVEKFENSINIFFSIALRRRKNIGNEVGKNLMLNDFSKSRITCYLIINNGNLELCNQITMELQNRLKKILDIYNINIVAINDIMAKKYKIII